jgi:hypothetical protein
VQKENYSEIVDFYYLINSIFNDKHNLKFQYYKILNWGVMPEKDYATAAVWNPNHPEYSRYLGYVELLEQLNDNRVIFNM